MSDPKHLRGADLLRAARRERPSSRARARTIRAATRAANEELTAWHAFVMGLVALGVIVASGSMTSYAPASTSVPELRVEGPFANDVVVDVFVEL